MIEFKSPRYPRPSEVAATLDRTADFLETHTWTAGNFKYNAKDRPANYCAVTALHTVAPITGTAATAALSVELGLQEAHDLPVWNDRQRDKRKVIRAMRRTARNIRARKLVREPGNRWVER